MRGSYYLWLVILFLVLLVILYIFVFVYYFGNQLKYPSPNTTPKPSSADLTYYYTVSMDNGSIISVNGDSYSIYQTIYSPLYKDSTLTLQNQIGSYSSATSILNIHDYLTFNCINGTDLSNCSVSLSKLTKSGIAVLSINDGDKSGTLSYVLNNNPSVKNTPPSNYIPNVTPPMYPIYFPNKSGDPNVYDIIGGTGFFLGKKGYVYISSTSDTRAIYIYYQ